MTDTIGARSDKDVGWRIRRGAALMAAARIATRATSFVTFVLLARLLDPHDLGVAALAVSTLALVQEVTDVRVTAALINLKELTNRHLDTAFTIGLIRGLLMTLILVAAAEPIAWLSRSPDLAAPLRVLALVPLVDGLRNPAFVLYQRNIDFRREFQRTLLSTLFGAAVLVAVAVATRSYWAIIAGAVAQRAVQSALTYWRVPVRIALSLAHAREFAAFGGWLTLAGALGIVREGIAPNTLIGRYLGTSALGLFSVAQTLSRLVTREISQPLAQAIAPGLAAILHDPERLRAAFRDAQATVFGLVLPAGVGLALIARDAIVLIAGPRWVDAAPVAAILAPALAFSILNAGSNAIATASGRTRLLAERNIVITLLTLPPLVAAAMLGDIRQVAWAVVFGVLVETTLTMRMAARLVGSPMFEPVALNWRTLLAAGAMAAALGAIGPSAETATGPLLAALLPRVALGAAIYVVVLYALWRLAKRPTGFETKMLDIVEAKLPARLMPVYRAVRARR